MMRISNLINYDVLLCVLMSLDMWRCVAVFSNVLNCVVMCFDIVIYIKM